MPLFKSIFEYHPTVNTIECFSLGLDLGAVFFFFSESTSLPDYICFSSSWN